MQLKDKIIHILKKMPFSDRIFSISVFLTVIFSALLIPAFFTDKSLIEETRGLKIKIGELTSLADEYRVVRVQIDEMEKKIGSPGGTGVAKVMDDLMQSLGIKGKMKSLKMLSTKEVHGGIIEESAEIQIEKTSLNELVNMFYLIGEGNQLLSLKKVNIKKSFEKNDILDITMTISLFSGK